MNLFPIIIVGLALVLLGLFAIALLTQKSDDDEHRGKKRKKTRDRDQIIKQANKRLTLNPKDFEALISLSEIYFSEHDWEKSLRTNTMLLEVVNRHPDEIDEKTIHLRYALSAYNMGMMEEACEGLLLARNLDPKLFEINYYLGIIEYKRKNLEKSAGYLNLACTANPDHLNSSKYLGLALHRLMSHKEAAIKLSQVVQVRPDDNEAQYFLAQSLYEMGHGDKAAQMFEHLRPDPVFGPHASVMVGSINLKNGAFAQARMDFELGLRHKNIKPEIFLELKYRLAATLMKQQMISDALEHLQDIYKTNPGYKDVETQIKRSSELSKNKHLQTYLMANDADFVSLCRRLSELFFHKATNKITDIQIRKQEYADILADVETSTWADVILFRFVRTTGTVGELILRDLHSRIKDTKAGRGFCICAGSFSATAKKFVEARFIDLVNKEVLTKAMSRL